MYDVAQITYQVYPSQATIDALRGKLQRFINTNNTSKQFAAKAAAAGYQAGQAQLTVEDAQINGLQSSRKAIQWVFKDASKGSVSPIFEDKGTSDQMIVVALDDIYPEGYFSMDIPEIKQMLTQKVRNSKKGDKLMAQYKGKANSLAAYGQLMGCAVDTTNVTFGQMFIPKIGQGESQLIGRVSVAKQGALQGPFKGNNAIYVYQVVKIDRTPRRPVNDELDRQYAMTRGYGAIMRNAVEILRKATTVKNNMIKFY
jgi:peptidyl-prolyl cis-trans isomerase D